jgi:hypothetical protein
MSVQLRGLGYVDHPFHSGQGTYEVIGWVADHICQQGSRWGGEEKKNHQELQFLRLESNG